MKPKKIAVLTPEENKAWDEDADQSTWKDLQNEFPRLQEFDGWCKP